MKDLGESAHNPLLPNETESSRAGLSRGPAWGNTCVAAVGISLVASVPGEERGHGSNKTEMSYISRFKGVGDGGL